MGAPFLLLSQLKFLFFPSLSSREEGCGVETRWSFGGEWKRRGGGKGGQGNKFKCGRLLTKEGLV